MTKTFSMKLPYSGFMNSNEKAGGDNVYQQIGLKEFKAAYSVAKDELKTWALAVTRVAINVMPVKTIDQRFNS
jgi:hypothetical protein